MNVREIELPNGKVAKVSAKDWRRVSPICWSDNGLGYVRGRWRKSLGGHGKIVFLHRFIMLPPPGMVVDHIDGNPLNNVRENLQITTNARNVMRSRVGGITFDKQHQQWRVRKRVDGSMMDFGLFNTRREAEEELANAMRLIWEDRGMNALGTVF